VQTLLLFLDGIGLGPPDRTRNPFVEAHTPNLTALSGGRLTDRLLSRSEPGLVVSRVDASLGHRGLPQSATGQATLLTGLNAADLMGGHYGPWPGPTLKAVLDRDSLFRDAYLMSGGACLANVYPPSYFEALNRGRLKVNAPVYAARAAGLSLPDVEDYRVGRAVSTDLTGEYICELRPDLNARPLGEAGRDLALLAADHTFTFFDFWLSDRIGHRGTLVEAQALVEQLDAFVGGIIETLGTTTLIVTSDHGNLENMSTRSHTRAPVPLLVKGPKAGRFEGLVSIQDIPQAIRAAWDD